MRSTMLRMMAWLRLGFAASISATVPATFGVAPDVPPNPCDRPCRRAVARHVVSTVAWCADRHAGREVAEAGPRHGTGINTLWRSGIPGDFAGPGCPGRGMSSLAVASLIEGIGIDLLRV